MKRYISIIVILVVIFSLTACKAQDDEEMSAVSDEIVENTQTDDVTTTPEQNQQTENVVTDNQQQAAQKEQTKPDTPVSSEPETKQETEATQKPQTSVSVETEEKAPDYASLSCKSSSGFNWNQVRFYNESKKSAVQLELPEGWTLNANGANSYDVISSGSKIGVISTAAPSAPKGKYDSTNYYDKEKKIFTFMDVYWYKENNKDRVERYFQFVCDESNFTINMNIEYTELDSTAVSRIKASALAIIQQPNISLETLDKSNGSKRYL